MHKKLRQRQQRKQFLIPLTFSKRSGFGYMRKRPREPKKNLTLQESKEIVQKVCVEENMQSSPQETAPIPNEALAPIEITPGEMVEETASASAPKATKEVQKPSILKSESTFKDKKMTTQSASMQSSPQKSANKAYWSTKDEIAFFEGILSYSSEGKGLPQKMGVVYDNVRPKLDREFNNSQLYNKFRHGRKKFNLITSKIEANNKYEFHSPHEAALYHMWMQLWGVKVTVSDEHGNYVEAKDGEAKMNPRNGQISRELYHQFCKERIDGVKEVEDVVKKLFNDAHSEVSAMFQRRFRQHQV